MASDPTDTKTHVSVFHEVGLDDSSLTVPSTLLRPQRPQLHVRFRSSSSIIPDGEDPGHESDEWEDIDCFEDSDLDDHDVDSVTLQPRASLPYRLTLLALFVALALPIVQSAPFFGRPAQSVPEAPRAVIQASALSKREDSPTDVCKRWSHQSALVNGTLYMYGGRAMESQSQDSNTWNNYLISLDLSKSWQISDPSFTGYPIPSGPPAVSNGFLWHSYDSLYLYGGEFSDNPTGAPTPESLWEYKIGSKEWKEHEGPKTSAGRNAEPEGQAVGRVAEGAGAGVAALGRGWYFGGHQDFLTTYEWSNQIGRIFIKSLIEFTFPGFSNPGIETLSNGQKAGDSGAWRNITGGGVQESNGFPERADGLLVFVPGFGPEGILLGLAGGSNSTFTQMNIIDVYDIANSVWYKQSTSGPTPKVRVNPCAVVAAAPDGSSYNMYMFAGQDLVPEDNTQQKQYDDMWILSMPSFTWIQVDTTNQSVPPGRSGHTCNVWDGQMVVVGGYVGTDLACDTPGVYVFNLTSLTWNNQFTALASNQNDAGSANDNPFSQQGNQVSNENEHPGLEGSYGYQVPGPVISAIGGSPLGGATITKPVATPDSSGPLATGGPITYTVTGPNGEVITSVANPGNFNNRGSDGPNVGAIVAGVIAGIFALVAGYFAFCAWIYRKQLQLYKNHASMAATRNGTVGEKDGFLGGAALAAATSKASSERRDGSTRPDSISHTLGSHHSRTASGGNSAGQGSGPGLGVNGGGTTAYEGRRASVDSTEDLLAGSEPSFWGTRGVLLNPRRSLRVINRD